MLCEDDEKCLHHGPQWEVYKDKLVNKPKEILENDATKVGHLRHRILHFMGCADDNCSIHRNTKERHFFLERVRPQYYNPAPNSLCVIEDVETTKQELEDITEVLETEPELESEIDSGEEGNEDDELA